MQLYVTGFQIRIITLHKKCGDLIRPTPAAVRIVCHFEEILLTYMVFTHLILVHLIQFRQYYVGASGFKIGIVTSKCSLVVKV